MATLTDLIRSRRESGAGIGQSIGKSIKEKLREKIDPRQFLNQSGLLVALFPKLKAFRAKPVDTKTKFDSPSMTFDLSPSVQNIEINTKITAKNMMVLPAMHRDINVMRQNIAKLVQLESVKPTVRADMWFKKSKFRESAYEQELTKKTEKTPKKLKETKKPKATKEAPTLPQTTFGKIAGVVGKVATSPLGKIAAGTAVAGAVGLTALTARGESAGGDYNIVIGGSKANLTSMTIGEVLQFQEQMKKSGKYRSTAVGKYQVLQSTLQGAVKSMNLNLNDKFDENMQERIFKEYLIGAKRKNVSDYLNAKVPDTPENLEKAQMDLALEFASYGVPRDVRQGEFGKYPTTNIRRGQSMYSGVAGNKASISPEDSAIALKQDRMRNEGKTVTPHPGTTPSGTPVPPKDVKPVQEMKSNKTGGKISEVSSDVQRSELTQPETNVVVKKEKLIVPTTKQSGSVSNPDDELASKFIFDRVV